MIHVKTTALLTKLVSEVEVSVTSEEKSFVVSKETDETSKEEKDVEEEALANHSGFFLMGVVAKEIFWIVRHKK